MNRTSIATVCLVLAAATASRAGEPVTFQFYKEVQRDDPSREAILAVALDSDVYAATQDDYADLRVVDGQGEEVPFRLEKQIETRTETLRKPCGSRVVSLVENDDNSIEIVVALEDKQPPADGLIFHTPLEDFERRVEILGSDAGDQWHPLVSDAVIFDYSRYMDVSNVEVALPENDYRRFKLIVRQVTDRQRSSLTELTRQFRGDEQQQRIERTTVRRRPLRIDRIELWHDVPQKRVEKVKKGSYKAVEFTSKEDADEQETVVEVRTHREPLTSFRLEIPDANFSREATVQVPVTKGVTTNWVEVGRATVSAIRFRGFQREHLKIEFPEQRHQQYRIVISNQDNPPLEITGVKPEGNVYRALFFAAEGAQYQVRYGSELAEEPSYDTAAISVARDQGYQPAAATVGPEEVNPAFGEGPGFQFATLLDNPYFLGGVIALMVIVLALLLYRAGRHVEQIPNE